MGSCSIYREFPNTKTQKQLVKSFEEMCVEAAYSHGHEYSGSWNMLRDIEFPAKDTFETLSDAEDYISEKAEKWGPAICVKFKAHRWIYKSPPTFGGKTAKELGVKEEIIYVKYDYTGYTYRPTSLARIDKCIPADQLTPEEAATAIRLYKENHFCTYDKSETGAKAKEAWKLFNEPLVRKLWLTTSKRYTAWLMGGQAAD